MLAKIGRCSMLLILLGIVPGFGQATRTWVSGVGDDANPCSRTAPCKTFAGTISKTAAGGEIDIIDPGAYGALTITKSITINAEGATAGIAAAGVNGILINAGANDVVVLRGLTLEGAGTGLNGVRFLAGKSLIVDKCLISGFRATSAGNGAGIAFLPSTTSQLVVTDTIITDNGGNGSNGGGIVIRPTGTAAVTALLENVQIAGNLHGLRVDGQGSTGGVNAVVRNSAVAHNSFNGINSVSAVGLVDTLLEGVTVHGNTSGVRSDGGLSIITLDRSSVFGNGTGLLPVFGGSILSFQNNAVDGNGTNGAPTGTLGHS
jgi:hypothetical protein